MAVDLEWTDRASTRAMTAAASPAAWMVFPAKIESRAKIWRCENECGLFPVCIRASGGILRRPAAVGGIDFFESQAFVFDHFAFLWDASGEFAYQSSDRGRFVPLGAHAEEFIQAVYIHVAGYDVGVVALLHHLGFLVLIANLPYYFFD